MMILFAAVIYYVLLMLGIMWFISSKIKVRLAEVNQ
jgi:hypothetical protein